MSRAHPIRFPGPTARWTPRRRVTGTFTISSAANSTGQGFVLRGLIFDFPGIPLTATDVEVSFANSGTGFGPTPPWVGSGGGTQTITLTFDINGAGVVSLDASTNSTNTVFKNRSMNGIVQTWAR